MTKEVLKLIKSELWRAKNMRRELKKLSREEPEDKDILNGRIEEIGYTINMLKELEENTPNNDKKEKLFKGGNA